MSHKKPLLSDQMEKALDKLFLFTLQRLKIFSEEEFAAFVKFYHENYIRKETHGQFFLDQTLYEKTLIE